IEIEIVDAFRQLRLAALERPERGPLRGPGVLVELPEAVAGNTPVDDGFRMQASPPSAPYNLPSSAALESSPRKHAMEFLQNYGLFLAKTVTVLLAFLVAVIVAAGLGSRSRGGSRERLEVTRLNDRLDSFRHALERRLLDRKALRRLVKQRARARRQAASRPRLFVLDFNGDLRASQVESLRQEISGILLVAGPEDEVLVRLQSGGGMVPNYGLAAAELARLKGRVRQLTIAIDRIAASGGYLMACVADRILAAPFAIV